MTPQERRQAAQAQAASLSQDGVRLGGRARYTPPGVLAAMQDAVDAVRHGDGYTCEHVIAAFAAHEPRSIMKVVFAGLPVMTCIDPVCYTAALMDATQVQGEGMDRTCAFCQVDPGVQATSVTNVADALVLSFLACAGCLHVRTPDERKHEFALPPRPWRHKSWGRDA